jgi:hypothetical protein
MSRHWTTLNQPVLPKVCPVCGVAVSSGLWHSTDGQVTYQPCGCVEQVPTRAEQRAR